jgi:hypothetical protein
VTISIAAIVSRATATRLPRADDTADDTPIDPSGRTVGPLAKTRNELNLGILKSRQLFWNVLNGTPTNAPRAAARKYSYFTALSKGSAESMGLAVRESAVLI